jgi:hypothetical protein
LLVSFQKICLSKLIALDLSNAIVAWLSIYIL